MTGAETGASGGVDATAIAAGLAAVRARVEAAARRAGRDPASVAVVCVTKRHPAAAVEAALAAGAAIVGENYVQELVSKRAAVSEAARDRLAWHYIGALQRNKVKALIGHATLIHAVDSARLAREIDRRAAAAGAVQDVLLAVNVGGEASKSGIAPDDVAALLAVIRGFSAVRCRGLMTMPPLPQTPEDSRPYFRELAALRDRLATADAPLPTLSMGTTGDFEIAVQEGATLVRVGTAIFGPRV